MAVSGSPSPSEARQELRRGLLAPTGGLVGFGRVLDVRDIEEDLVERLAAQPCLCESGSCAPATAIAAIDESQQRGEDVAAVLRVSGEGAKAGALIPGSYLSASRAGSSPAS